MTWALFDNLNGKWKRFLGVDISPISVELYNQKAATQFTPEEMHAVCLELTGQPGELGGEQFDIIVVRRPLFHRPNLQRPNSSLLLCLFFSISLFPVLASLPPLCKREHRHGHPRLLSQARRQTLHSGPDAA